LACCEPFSDEIVHILGADTIGRPLGIADVNEFDAPVSEERPQLTLANAEASRSSGYREERVWVGCEVDHLRFPVRVDRTSAS